MSARYAQNGTVTINTRRHVPACKANEGSEADCPDGIGAHCAVAVGPIGVRAATDRLIGVVARTHRDSVGLPRLILRPTHYESQRSVSAAPRRHHRIGGCSEKRSIGSKSPANQPSRRNPTAAPNPVMALEHP